MKVGTGVSRDAQRGLSRVQRCLLVGITILVEARCYERGLAGGVG